MYFSDDISNGFVVCLYSGRLHVNFFYFFPTHVHGHWQDLLITKRIPNSIKSVFSAAGKQN